MVDSSRVIDSEPDILEHFHFFCRLDIVGVLSEPATLP